VRLDLFLKKTYLVKRRELARELCDEGMVRVNGTPRKASQEVKAGDELAFPVYNRHLRVKILALPEGNVAKGDQWSFVELLEDRWVPVDDFGGPDPAAKPPKPPTFH